VFVYLFCFVREHFRPEKSLSNVNVVALKMADDGDDDDGGGSERLTDKQVSYDDDDDNDEL
jgi:hypothetical protein